MKPRPIFPKASLIAATGEIGCAGALFELRGLALLLGCLGGFAGLGLLFPKDLNRIKYCCHVFFSCSRGDGARLLIFISLVHLD
jgi:hypothetical protein